MLVKYCDINIVFYCLSIISFMYNNSVKNFFFYFSLKLTINLKNIFTYLYNYIQNKKKKFIIKIINFFFISFFFFILS